MSLYVYAILLHCSKFALGFPNALGLSLGVLFLKSQIVCSISNKLTTAVLLRKMFYSLPRLNKWVATLQKHFVNIYLSAAPAYWSSLGQKHVGNIPLAYSGKTHRFIKCDPPVH